MLATQGSAHLLRRFAEGGMPSTHSASTRDAALAGAPERDGRARDIRGQIRFRSCLSLRGEKSRHGALIAKRE